jgi:hypothetical protein
MIGVSVHLIAVSRDRSHERKDGTMARSVRIEFPGAYYHVMARSNRREAIFWITMINVSFCDAEA